MSECGVGAGMLRLQRRLTPVLAALSAIVSLVFSTHFLVVRLGKRGATTATVATVVLLGVAVAQFVAASSLARLEPPAWTVGVVTFAATAVVSLAVLLVETRALSAAYVGLNLALVASTYRMRPLYTPESEKRQRALAAMDTPRKHAWLSQLREEEPDGEVVLFVAFVLLAATVTFYKGVKLYFQPDSLSTTVGTAYLGFALLQFRACYGLWLGSGRGWVLSALLCSLATLVAAYHALVAEDVVSFAIVLFDALSVAQLYRLRARYVGKIAIGRPPE